MKQKNRFSLALFAILCLAFIATSMIAFANPQGKIESTSMNSAPLSIVSNDFMKAGDLSSIQIRERNQNQLTSENNFVIKTIIVLMYQMRTG